MILSTYKDMVDSVLSVFGRAVILVMLGLLMAVVSIGVFELVVLLAQQLANEPLLILELDEFREFFSFCLMVLVGVQLIAALRASLADGKLHVDVLLLAGLIALTQKMLVVDYARQSMALFASAAAILGLCGGYFLLRRATPVTKSGRQRNWEGDK